MPCPPSGSERNYTNIAKRRRMTHSHDCRSQATKATTMWVCVCYHNQSFLLSTIIISLKSFFSSTENFKSSRPPETLNSQNPRCISNYCFFTIRLVAVGDSIFLCMAAPFLHLTQTMLSISGWRKARRSHGNVDTDLQPISLISSVRQLV